MFGLRHSMESLYLNWFGYSMEFWLGLWHSMELWFGLWHSMAFGLISGIAWSLGLVLGIPYGCLRWHEMDEPRDYEFR